MADIIQRAIDASARGDLYAVLGAAPLPRDEDSSGDALRRCSVLRDLPLSSIRTAFVAMSLACHPDKCKHERATDAQQAVNKAWEVLKERSSRVLYDVSFRAMIQKEHDKKQQEELKKQKMTKTVLTQRTMQQQKTTDAQPAD